LFPLFGLAQSAQHLLAVFLQLGHSLTPSVAAPLVLSILSLQLPCLLYCQTSG
jgi:hypothetical protein